MKGSRSGRYLRKKYVQQLPHQAVAEERRLVHLTDGSQQTALAVHAECKQVVLDPLKCIFFCIVEVVASHF